MDRSESYLLYSTLLLCSSANSFLLVLSSPMASQGEAAMHYTTDDALTRVGFGRFQALLLVFLGTGSVAEAMEAMLLSFVGPSVKMEWGISAAEEGLVTSVVFVGTVVGACLGGLGSDKYSRRLGVLITALVTSISGFLCAFSPNYPTLLALRFVVAIGWLDFLVFGALEQYWWLYLLGITKIYHTSCRNTGVGISNCIGQVGSIVAPLVTVTLVGNCCQKEAVFVIDLLLFLAGVACVFFPLETRDQGTSNPLNFIPTRPNL